MVRKERRFKMVVAWIALILAIITLVVIGCVFFGGLAKFDRLNRKINQLDPENVSQRLKMAIEKITQFERDIEEKLSKIMDDFISSRKKLVKIFFSRFFGTVNETFGPIEDKPEETAAAESEQQPSEDEQEST